MCLAMSVGGHTIFRIITAIIRYRMIRFKMLILFFSSPDKCPFVKKRSLFPTVWADDDFSARGLCPRVHKNSLDFFDALLTYCTIAPYSISRLRYSDWFRLFYWC